MSRLLRWCPPSAKSAEVVQPEPTVQMTSLDRLRAEEEVETWLSDHDIADPWDLAPSLVGAGWSPELLEKLAGGLESQLAPHWIRLIALRASAGQLIREIAIGASRISELVRVVKHYSFLDQGPIQELVVTSGIDDTLILLRHKLRGIEVIRNYDPDLANVVAAGRDLNQVWTNLIDNAADAMENGGTLTIAAKNEGDSVVVSVADTGTGIPPEVAERIFDPFFTTKEPGKGTGLGLHTAHTILSRAGGTISVASNGSGTTFTVTLPAAQS